MASKGGQKSGEIMEIAMELVDPPMQPSRSEINKTYIEELAGNIKAVGLINAVTVFPEGKRYRLVAGHCRFLAHKHLGELYIRAQVIKKESLRADLIQISENLIRNDLSAMEEAGEICAYMKIHKVKQKEMSKLISKSEAWVSGRLALLEYPEPLQTALYRDQISVSVARELVRITDEKTRNYYLFYAIENGSSPGAAKKWADEFLNTLEQSKKLDEMAKPTAPAGPPQPVLVKCWGCQEMVNMDDAEMVYICGSCTNQVSGGEPIP